MTRKFIISFLVCFLLFPDIALAQTQTNKDEVAPAEKEQIQAVCKRFVEQLMQIREVKPLVPEFFLKDFVPLINKNEFEIISPKLLSKLTDEEKVRLYLDGRDLLYLNSIVLMVADLSKGNDEDAFTQIIGKDLVAKITKASFLNNESEFTDRKSLLNALIQTEQFLKQIHTILEQKKYEESPKYKKAFAEGTKSNMLNYGIEVGSLYESVVNKTGQLRFPGGTKTYNVNTPILIRISLIKENGEYKIFSLWPFGSNID